MLTLRRAFKNIFRRSFRTLLVSFVLALCVAVLISTITGVRASEQSTKEMVARVEANTAEMVAEVQANTEEMVAGIEASTEEMVAGVEQGAEETIGLTEMMSRMIMVSTGFGFGPMGGGMGGEGTNLISEDVVDDIYSIEGVAAVLPTLTERVGAFDDPRDYDYAVNGILLDPSLVEESRYCPQTSLRGAKLRKGMARLFY